MVILVVILNEEDADYAFFDKSKLDSAFETWKNETIKRYNTLSSIWDVITGNNDWTAECCRH